MIGLGRSPAFGSADPLEGPAARRVRNVLALGAVPFDELDDGVAPGRSEDDRVLEMAVAAGLERLSLTQRQVIVLRFFCDLPVRYIAVALDIPEGTVKSRLHGAVPAMRDRLREDDVI